MLIEILIWSHLSLFGNLIQPPTVPAVMASSSVALSTHSISLALRHSDGTVNSVFKDNILLTLSYMTGRTRSKEDLDWSSVLAPQRYEFTLNPQETFAFHDQARIEFTPSLVKTTNAHFNYSDGFKSSGFLFGDGVCHLASLLNWTAKDAGLSSIYFANHDFSQINEIPKEYGVSIKTVPGQFSNSSTQNLYITNILDRPVTFSFDYDGTNLTLKILKGV